MTNISKKNKKPNKLKGKKILYLITQTKCGGAQKYVLELAEYFGQNNTVHIAYGEDKNIDKQFINNCKKLSIKTIAIPYLRREIDLGKDYLAVPEILKLLNKENYNLLHLNSSKVGLLGSLAAKIYSFNPLNLKLRIAYTAHGFVFNEPLTNRRKKMYKFSEKISTGFQHLVITVSDADRQSALDNNISPGYKMFTIHNGLNFNKYNFYNRQEARKKLNLETDNPPYAKAPEGRKYFATIANFYKTKGYQYLIEAIKGSSLLENHRWILIGDGPELDDIKKQVNQLHLNKHIKFVGRLDNGWKYLKAFDYFVLPSIKEGLPYTILEAGLAEIPTVATKVGGIPEILTNEKTGLLVSPANPLALRNAMEQISQNDDLANKLAENNHQNIKNNFDLKNTLARTEELYLKIL
ncbi:glycosyltransferase [bacterium]|nr:glycosyltransferase [bacterium]